MRHQGKPEWLKIQYQDPQQIARVKRLLQSLSLHTVCNEANCPNKMECFGKGTATFMVLGSVCTRNCRFCNVRGGTPEPVDPQEPENLARAVEELGLRHVVVTTVTRDDLPDGGAEHFARVIRAVRGRSGATIEVLISDLQGSREALDVIVAEKPEIINHNLETVPSLYGRVRPQADYGRSLELLRQVKGKDPGIFTKSGIMVGLGETPPEVQALFGDLRAVGCDFLTIGQYLSPSPEHLPVAEYVPPEQFERYRAEALDRGFLHVASGPFVRSSYNAAALRDLVAGTEPGKPG